VLITIAIVAFLLIVLSNFFFGLWNNILTLCNVLISALFASSFFETTANTIESLDPTYTYVADFLGAWAVFFISFIVLRLATDVLSKNQLQLHPAFNFPCRLVALLAAAWIFVCFAFFTLHMAPAKPDLIAGGPDAYGPGRMWLEFMHSRSKGALSEFKNTPVLPPYQLTGYPEENWNVRVFDPHGDFVYKYRHRRDVWSGEEQLRVYRQQ